MKTKRIITAALLGMTSFVSADLVTGLTVQSGTSNPFNVIPMGPAKAINGEGLPGDTPTLTGTHGVSFDEQWWTYEGMGAGNPAIPAGAQITIDLGANYKLDGIQVWNYNEGGVTERGIQNCEIYVSPDDDPANLVKLVTDGTGNEDNGDGDFLLPRGPGSGTYQGFLLDTTGISNSQLLDNVRLFQIIPLDSYDSVAGAGIAEIQFDGSAPILNTEPLQLTIAATDGTLEFSWSSVDGKAYDLVSSTDLSVPIAQWAIFEDGENVRYENILSTVPTNTVPAVVVTDTKRFFALVEKNAPAP